MIYGEGSESEFIGELSWCPECQSPPTHDYAHVRYCDQHALARDGASDRLVEDTGYITRSYAGGVNNTAVCAFFYRTKGDL